MGFKSFTKEVDSVAVMANSDDAIACVVSHVPPQLRRNTHFCIQDHSTVLAFSKLWKSCCVPVAYQEFPSWLSGLTNHSFSRIVVTRSMTRPVVGETVTVVLRTTVTVVTYKLCCLA